MKALLIVFKQRVMTFTMDITDRYVFHDLPFPGTPVLISKAILPPQKTVVIIPVV